MKIAVINEVSARSRNEDIIKSLEKINVEVFNVGMTANEDGPELTYIQTGLMTAILLNVGACDMVIGGCGTGQGYLNSAMMYPNVFTGLVLDPLDAWLFSQINGGNCISLALNKGYGWAAEKNLDYIFEKLFQDPPGQGFPLERQKSQAESRRRLADISAMSHLSLDKIIEKMDQELLRPISHSEKFMGLLRKHTSISKLAADIFKLL